MFFTFGNPQITNTVKTSIVYTIIGLLMINTLSGQVKIGNNPQNLDLASVLELESTTRVLVITRVTDAQMSVINPLPGAIVYNTDQECLHYYNGTEWINICEELDNSFTVSTRADYLSLLNPQARDSTVVITQTNNPDGSINYNYEVGQITGANIVTQSINADSKIQPTSITTGLLAPKSVTIGKLADATGGQPGDIFQWNGSQWTLVNESVLGITEKDSIVGNEVVGPTDATLLLDGDGTEAIPFTLDVAPFGIDTPELADDAVTTLKISDGNVTNAKLDKTNIPLSGFGAAGANVDLGNQNLVNVADPTNPLDAVNLQYLEGAITASELLDNDTDDTNELSDLALDASNILTLSNPVTGGNQVDLTTFVNNDTNELSDIQLNATTIELTNPAAGATGVDLDLTFATDTELANAITASEAADNDTDDTNELSDLGLDPSNILTLSNPATGGNQVDLTQYVNDDTNELSDIQLNATTIELTNPATGATGVDLDLTFVTDTELANAITASETADNDTDDTNELSDLGLDPSNILTLSNPATGGNQVDLTQYVNDDTNENQTVSAGDGVTVIPSGQDFNVAVTNPVIAIGRVIGGVDNSTGAIVTNNGSGSYTVDLSTTPSNYVVQLTTIGGIGARTIQVTTQTGTQFNVQVYDGTGAVSDSDWNYTVIAF